ncbi:hypothetical protein Tco_1284213 [Tanacetum coccineum]
MDPSRSWAPRWLNKEQKIRVPSNTLAKGNVTKAFDWSRPTRNDMRAIKETYQGWDFCTKTSGKEAQGSNMRDCHAGNPCAHFFDQRATNYDPMIRSNRGLRSRIAFEE